MSSFRQYVNSKNKEGEYCTFPSIFLENFQRGFGYPHLQGHLNPETTASGPVFPCCDRGPGQWRHGEQSSDQPPAVYVLFVVHRWVLLRVLVLFRVVLLLGTFSVLVHDPRLFSITKSVDLTL